MSRQSASLAAAANRLVLTRFAQAGKQSGAIRELNVPAINGLRRVCERGLATS